jgi:hypothetical protein
MERASAATAAGVHAGGEVEINLEQLLVEPGVAKHGVGQTEPPLVTATKEMDPVGGADQALRWGPAVSIAYRDPEPALIPRIERSS